MCFLCNLLETKFSKGVLKRNNSVGTVPNTDINAKNDIIRQFNRDKRTYKRRLNSAMKQLSTGKITKEAYLKLQKENIKTHFTKAFLAGKVFSQSTETELSDSERRFIVHQTTEEMKYMSKFADDIVNKTGRMNYQRRMDMYSAGLDPMFEFGNVAYLPEDVMIEWQLGRTDKHCLDCLSFAYNSPYKKKELPGVPRSGNSRCFVGSVKTVSVLTPDGFVGINKIKIGDLVLSHKGKWRKVTGIINEKTTDEYCYEIIIKSDKKTKNKKIIMLDDHLSIVNGKWTRADELKVGDLIQMIGHRCKRCGKIIKYFDKRAINNTYCSIACSNKDIDRWKAGRQKLKDENRVGEGLRKWRENPENVEKQKEYGKKALEKIHKYRIGKTYDELYGQEKADELRYKCTKIANEKTRLLVKEGKNALQIFMNSMTPEEKTKFCKKAQKTLTNIEIAKSKETTIKRKIRLGKYKFYKTELKMIELLNYLNIKWEAQKRLDTYFYDFYLTDYDIYIEIDGDFWHCNPKIYTKMIEQQRKHIERDILKNKTIEKYNKTLLRFWEDDIYNNPDIVINKLKLILKNHNNEFVPYYQEIISVKKVKITDLRNRRTLSLTVDTDSSYVTNQGLIAHNCLSNCLCSLSYSVNGKEISGYVGFITKNYNSSRHMIPTEDDVSKLINMTDDFYYTRMSAVLTKDKTDMEKAKSIKSTLLGYLVYKDLSVSIPLPVASTIKEFKTFINNDNFELVTDYKKLKKGMFVSLFKGGKQTYGTVYNVSNNKLVVSTLKNEREIIDTNVTHIFKEVGDK